MPPVIRGLFVTFQQNVRKAWFPIVISMITFSVFSTFGLAAGQVQEVLANYVDAQTGFAWLRASVSLLAVLIFACTLRHWTACLVDVDIHAPSTRGWSLWQRLFVGFAWYAPWLGAALSFAQAHVTTGGSLDWNDFSGQILTHPFALLTAICGVAPGVLLLLWWTPPASHVRQSMFNSRSARLGSSWVLPTTFVALAIYFFFMPPSAIVFARTIGPVPIISLGLAVLTSVGSYLILVSRRRSIPLFTLAALTPIILGALGYDDNHYVRQLARERELERPPLIDAFYQFADEAPREPIVLISTEGGGVRAAQFTAMVLARMADQCPRLARRIFAISAVSGGAIGAAAYSASLDVMPLEGDKCELDEDAPPGARELALTDMLSRDHLSPTLAKMAFPELVQTFLPAASPDAGSAFLPDTDRQLGLELTFEQAFADAFDLPRGARNPFERSVFEAGDGPHLVINTTLVSTGGDYAVSDLDLSGVREQDPWLHDFRCIWAERREDGAERCDRSPDFRLSTIAATSSRFPVISPAGTAAIVDGTAYRFVDGGYFDNSGIEAMLAMLDHLRTERSFATDIRPRLIVMHIDSNPFPAEAEPPARRGRLDFDVHELQAVLATREERVRMSFNALRNLESERAVCGVSLVEMDQASDVSLRLGWILSNAAAAELQRQAARQLALQYRAGDLPRGACHNPSRPSKRTA